MGRNINVTTKEQPPRLEDTKGLYIAVIARSRSAATKRSLRRGGIVSPEAHNDTAS